MSAGMTDTVSRGAAPMNLTLAQAAAWLPGARLVGDGATVIARVHTDTRTLQPGDLFVALKGERFDANDFLADARAAGAVAAIAHGGLEAAGLPGLEVADTRLALGALAAAWRARFTLPLIAVTGSNGKTTVTQMIASILRAHAKDAAFATQGNLNNDIGVPLTLLRLRASHRLGVVELGMNHVGEIGYLANIARPTVALVNNAQREHLEFMATVEAVARENGAVLRSLGSGGERKGEGNGGIAVFPAAEEFTALWTAMAREGGASACLTFRDTSSGTGADAAGADIVLAGTEWLRGCWQVGVDTPAGRLDYSLHIAGRHNVRNSLAATACALAAGVPLASIARGLSDFEPVKGRSRAMSVAFEGREITLVDDTYNANPDSVRAAIDVLAELPGPRLLVLGDMGEVGDQGPAFHREVGAYARERGIERLLTLGEQSAEAARAFGAGRHFGQDIAALEAAAAQALPGTRSVLVKGSRFMKMERAVEAVVRVCAESSTQPTPEEGPHAA